MYTGPINRLNYKGIDVISLELASLLEKEPEEIQEETPKTDVIPTEEQDEAKEFEDLMKFLEAESAMHTLIQRKQIEESEDIEERKSHIPSYNEIASIYKKKQTEGKIIDVKA